MAEKLKITLVKSPIGAIPKQKATVAGSWFKQDWTRQLSCRTTPLSEA